MKTLTLRLTDGFTQRFAPVFTQKANRLVRSITIIGAISLLSACMGTQVAPVVSLENNFVRIDHNCIVQVNEQQQALEIAQASQYLSLANTASFCIKDIAFSPQHPDVQTAMQFNALAFVNFVKAGDMQAASSSLIAFRQNFPQQDLFFDDYSSFVDTATTLVKQHTLSQQQVDLMNINQALRTEIRRQHDWALN